MVINELEKKTNEYNLLLRMDSSAQRKLLTETEGRKRHCIGRFGRSRDTGRLQ